MTLRPQPQPCCGAGYHACTNCMGPFQRDCPLGEGALNTPGALFLNYEGMGMCHIVCCVECSGVLGK